jgi:hypothetical protein
MDCSFSGTIGDGSYGSASQHIRVPKWIAVTEACGWEDAPQYLRKAARNPAFTPFPTPFRKLSSRLCSPLSRSGRRPPCATRSPRRIREIIGDLVGRAVTNKASSDQYFALPRICHARHGDGGDGHERPRLFDMVEDSDVNTRIAEYRPHGPDTAINGRGSGALTAGSVSSIITQLGRSG